MPSAAEREMRNVAAERLRELLPHARICHELKTAVNGERRVDLAAVTETKIVAVEIKSGRDKLDRLADQMIAFKRAFDLVIAFADEKHFMMTNGVWRLPGAGHEVWCYPDRDGLTSYDMLGWTLPRSFWKSAKPCNAGDMLDLLWKAELDEECRKAGISKCKTRGHAIHLLSHHLTGNQVRTAVCGQLRARPFAEADPAILANTMCGKGKTNE